MLKSRETFSNTAINSEPESKSGVVSDPAVPQGHNIKRQGFLTVGKTNSLAMPLYHKGTMCVAVYHMRNS